MNETRRYIPLGYRHFRKFNLAFDDFFWESCGQVFLTYVGLVDLDFMRLCIFQTRAIYRHLIEGPSDPHHG